MRGQALKPAARDHPPAQGVWHREPGVQRGDGNAKDGGRKGGGKGRDRSPPLALTPQLARCAYSELRQDETEDPWVGLAVQPDHS